MQVEEEVVQDTDVAMDVLEESHEHPPDYLEESSEMSEDSSEEEEEDFLDNFPDLEFNEDKNGPESMPSFQELMKELEEALGEEQAAEWHTLHTEYYPYGTRL
ncbi:hypothetical protein NEOLEDRAFT_1180783 [Neolentinus lepideus HHB14362 ss-1]|uniref:Uncharacterized protein n=1 Tax=Neolentinus lepideus HHB14362 ss-1 TaxID=1314782 RepID=A0A165QKA1_9AGAM|nr:hypothetical protein NEOLEDRAFT_1180783 [Neolentinus lepideus HHB14362 ss-1]